jgi:hypothetical protein
LAIVKNLINKLTYKIWLLVYKVHKIRLKLIKNINIEWLKKSVCLYKLILNWIKNFRTKNRKVTSFFKNKVKKYFWNDESFDFGNNNFETFNIQKATKFMYFLKIEFSSFQKYQSTFFQRKFSLFIIVYSKTLASTIKSLPTI